MAPRLCLPLSQVRKEVYLLGLLSRLLETRLLQVLRFQYGEIYTASVSYFFGCEAVSNTGGAGAGGQQRGSAAARRPRPSSAARLHLRALWHGRNPRKDTNNSKTSLPQPPQAPSAATCPSHSRAILPTGSTCRSWRWPRWTGFRWAGGGVWAGAGLVQPGATRCGDVCE
jgi:hypothetical protein